MIEIAPGWGLELDRGPHWLYVHLRVDPKATREAPLAESIWSLLDQEFTYRLVLEMDETPILSSWVLGELVLLHKRIHSRGGLMRLCGLSEGATEIMRRHRLDTRLVIADDRTHAVMGRPRQPR